jgi:hypothetical protein
VGETFDATEGSGGADRAERRPSDGAGGDVADRGRRRVTLHALARVEIAVMAAVVAGGLAFRAASTGHQDFGQLWFAARAVLAGQDPYPLIGPGRPFEWPAPVFYPLPAALLAVPFAPWSEPVATAAFAALSIFALAWTLTRRELSGAILLASAGVVHAAMLGQWSPLFTASVGLPVLAVVLVVKPTIGAAFFVARPTRWAVVGGLALLALSFAVQPHWVASWMANVHSVSFTAGRGYPYVAPVTYPGGFLVLAALTRWRRMDARLLVMMACVPHTTIPYELVPLCLIPQGWKEQSVFAALTYLPLLLIDPSAAHSLAERVETMGHVLVAVAYLPATIMVLRRPNVA